MLQTCINHHLLLRDYPFQKYAVLSHPKYTYVNHKQVCYIETLPGPISKNRERKDHYFYTLNNNKPSTSNPVFELTICTKQALIKAFIYTPVGVDYSAIYNPIYTSASKAVISAAIKYVQVTYPDHPIIIEDNMYILSSLNKQVCYSDICFLLTGKIWLYFLPIKHYNLNERIATENAYKSLQSTQWHTIAQVFKQHNVPPIIIDKNINPAHIGSARRVLKDLKRQKSLAWFAEHMHLLFLGFNIKSFNNITYIMCP